jgi:hypothetical protein
MPQETSSVNRQGPLRIKREDSIASALSIRSAPLSRAQQQELPPRPSAVRRTMMMGRAAPCQEPSSATRPFLDSEDEPASPRRGQGPFGSALSDQYVRTELRQMAIKVRHLEQQLVTASGMVQFALTSVGNIN